MSNKLSLVSDLGVLCLFQASMNLWQIKLLACRKDKIRPFLQFLSLNCLTFEPDSSHLVHKRTRGELVCLGIESIQRKIKHRNMGRVKEPLLQLLLIHHLLCVRRCKALFVLLSLNSSSNLKQLIFYPYFTQKGNRVSEGRLFLNVGSKEKERYTFLSFLFRSFLLKH